MDRFSMINAGKLWVSRAEIQAENPLKSPESAPIHEGGDHRAGSSSPSKSKSQDFHAPTPLTCPHCQGTDVRCIGRVEQKARPAAHG